MADRNAKVQERIREELAQNPEATTGELQAAAQSIDASVGELSLRQFNAGYVLPLKRRSGAGKAKTAHGGRKQAAGARRRGPIRKRDDGDAAPKARAPERPAAPAAPSVSGDRDLIRATLLQFAQDFSQAESRSEIVGVLSNLDSYVDRIVGSRR